MTAVALTKLKHRFAAEFNLSIQNAKKARLNFPHRTVQMRASIGDEQTATAIVSGSPDPSCNAWAFIQAGMIELTIEALVIRHRQLFDNAVVRMAIRRLRKLGR